MASTPESRREYQRQYYKKNREHRSKIIGEWTKRWRLANPEIRRERDRIYKHVRRARQSKARIEEYIQLKNLHNWESKICGICSEFIEGKYHLDHIIPLSRGGEHSTKNLQLAHPFCNQSKFNHLPVEPDVVLLT